MAHRHAGRHRRGVVALTAPRACGDAVAFLDVTLRRGERDILSGVTLDFASGEFVGVLGPNGAGKTTFLRAILGLVPPSRGAITVLGAPVSRGNAAIGYMPQSRVAHGASGLSGRAILRGAVQGHRLGWSRGADAAVDAALDLVGGRTLAERPLGALSGGERQRLLLAQALMGAPRLLLLDEPLISLDVRHQRSVIALVRDVQRALGITVLFSAHDLNPLLGAMDRVLYLGAGRAALGAVDDVVTGPVLSALYGTSIEVFHADGRIFVTGGERAHC